MPGHDAGRARTSRLIVTIFGDVAEEMRGWIGPAEDAVRDRYLAAFRRALPDLSAKELWFRMRGILAVVAVDRVDVYHQPASASPSPGSGRGGPALGDHVPGGGDECATDRDLTSRWRQRTCFDNRGPERHLPLLAEPP